MSTNYAAQVADLCGAAWSGNVERVKTLLKALPATAVNQAGPHGTNALYCACRSDQANSEIVLDLLNFTGIDLNLQFAPHGGTAAHAASFTERCEIVTMLLFKGADFKRVNAVGLTARQEAKGAVIDIYEMYETEQGQEALRAKYPIVKRIKLEKKDKADKRQKKGIKILKGSSHQQEDKDDTSISPRRSYYEGGTQILKSTLIRFAGTETPLLQSRMVVLTQGLLRCFTNKEVTMAGSSDTRTKSHQLKEQHKMGGLIVAELGQDTAHLLDAYTLPKMGGAGHYFAIKNPAKELRLWKNPIVFSAPTSDLAGRWLIELQAQNPMPNEGVEAEFRAMFDAFTSSCIPAFDIPIANYENVRALPHIPFIHAPFRSSFMQSPFYQSLDASVWQSPFKECARPPSSPFATLKKATSTLHLDKAATAMADLLADTLNIEADALALDNILAEIDTDSDFLFSDPNTWGPDPSTWGLTAFQDIHEIPFDNPNPPPTQLYYCDSSFMTQDGSDALNPSEERYLRLYASPFTVNPTWQYPRDLIRQFELETVTMSIQDCTSLFVFSDPPMYIPSADVPIFTCRTPRDMVHEELQSIMMDTQEPTLHKIDATPLPFHKVKLSVNLAVEASDMDISFLKPTANVEDKSPPLPTRKAPLLKLGLGGVNADTPTLFSHRKTHDRKTIGEDTAT